MAIEFNKFDYALMYTVLDELLRQPYEELNKSFGSFEIKGMLDLKTRLKDQLIEENVFEEEEEC